MSLDALKRFATSLKTVAVLSLLLLVSLYLLSNAIDNSAKFDQQYLTLIVINLIGLAILLALIGANIYRLVQHHRSGIAGSRLTTRMLTMFIIIAVIPVSVLFYFSLDFLNRGIDSWFDVSIESAFNDALELSRSSMDARMRELVKRSTELADELSGVSDDVAVLTIAGMRDRIGASDITLFGANDVIASSSSQLSIFNPKRPDESIITRVLEKGSYASLDPTSDSGLDIRVIVKVSSQDPTAKDRVLQIRYPVTERFNKLAENVQSAFAKYKRLVYLRNHLKFSFLLTLSLVLLLTILTAVWAAFFSAQRLTQPIRDLAAGTRAVAEGDYSKRLPVGGKDELNFLVESFNEMTRRIQRASDEVKHSKALTEAQHAYLETVLSRLSSGVISIDANSVIRTVNQTASQILGSDMTQWLDHPCSEPGTTNSPLEQFFAAVRTFLMSGREWRIEITLPGTDGRQVLMCRGAPLHNADGTQNGDVIVFDDITALIQAQRDAAWGEVARRLAHEIKNPLTPIQLSAERLRHKFLAKLNDKDKDILDRATHTISTQVETMKEMVNAFSEYARAPQIHLSPVDINTIIKEVIELYQGDKHSRFQLKLDSNLPVIEADSGRLRQLLHNLIKNSLEATASARTVEIAISTCCLNEENCQFIELHVSDNGPGIDAKILPQLFEPYVTNKTKGTGLGLAIVKKIVEEHGGHIRADNNPEGGASLYIKLPVTSANLVTQV